MLDSGSAAVRDRNAAALDSRLCDRQEGMAERVGFEPTLPFRVNTLSKRAPSATRPSLRVLLKGRRAQEPGLTLFYRTASGAPAPRPPLLSRTPKEQDVPILIFHFEPSQSVAIV